MAKSGKDASDIGTNDRFATIVQQFSDSYTTIGEMVYAMLKQAVLSGAFAPGEWLRQEALAAAMGVSRLPVRSALMKLDTEGLISFYPHKGALIHPLTPLQMNELYRLRMLLETHALRLSMPRMTEERLKAIRDLADQMDAGVEGGEFLKLRAEFDRLLYDIDNNPLLVQIIEDVRGRVFYYLLGARLGEGLHGRHGELVDLVEQRDLAGAEGWIWMHLESIRKGMEGKSMADLAEVPESQIHTSFPA